MTKVARNHSVPQHGSVDRVARGLALSARLLLSSVGASLIGLIASGVGAEIRTVEAKSRDVVSIFDYMSAAQAAEIRSATSTNDTSAIVLASTASRKVMLPAGTYRLEDFNIPDNTEIVGDGAGRTILKLRTGAVTLRTLFIGNKSNIRIKNLTIDGDGVSSALLQMLLCDNVKVSGVALTGSNGDGVLGDGLVNCSFIGMKTKDSGLNAGYAQIRLISTSGIGINNTVQNFTANNILGRCVGFFDQKYSSATRVYHDATNIARGEVVYFYSCIGCSMKTITQIGGGAGAPAVPNPGNDGVSIDFQSVGCSAEDIHLEDVSGHGISISLAAKKCRVTGARIFRPDECGISLTDQGVVGYFPQDNIITDCYVEDPGMRTIESAYSATGYRNIFKNCIARDTRATKRMTYGFQEYTSANPAGNNHWEGIIDPAECLTAAYILASPTSSAILLNDTCAATFVSFDSTGANGPKTLLRKSYNVISVDKTATGTCRVNFRNNLPTNAVTTGSARFFGGNNFVTVNTLPNAAYVDILVVNDAGTATDSDYVSVVVL